MGTPFLSLKKKYNLNWLKKISKGRLLEINIRVSGRRVKLALSSDEIINLIKRIDIDEWETLILKDRIITVFNIEDLLLNDEKEIILKGIKDDEQINKLSESGLYGLLFAALYYGKGDLYSKAHEKLLRVGRWFDKHCQTCLELSIWWLKLFNDDIKARQCLELATSIALKEWEGRTDKEKAKSTYLWLRPAHSWVELLDDEEEAQRYLQKLGIRC